MARFSGTLLVLLCSLPVLEAAQNSTRPADKKDSPPHMQAAASTKKHHHRARVVPVRMAPGHQYEEMHLAHHRRPQQAQRQNKQPGHDQKAMPAKTSKTPKAGASHARRSSPHLVAKIEKKKVEAVTNGLKKLRLRSKQRMRARNTGRELDEGLAAFKARK